MIDEKFDKELLAIFKKTYRPVLTEFKQALSNNDVEYLQLISHKLSMSAELIGEKELAEIAERIEKSIIEKRTVEHDSCEKILEKLSKIVD